MTDDAGELGSWVIVYTVENGGQYRVAASHWDELSAAYAHWYERRIDRVLALTGLAGSDILVAASRMSDVCLSTHDSRVRDGQLEAAMKAEQGYGAE